MSTELVNEGNASTLSQHHVNEMVHHVHLNEYGNLSNLPDLEPDLHSDKIQSQQVILRNVPMTKKMNRTPDSAKQNDKSLPFR